MNLKTLTTAAGISLLSATASGAATVNVGGTDYDVTTITGSFFEYQTILESQIWFGASFLASAFATATGDTLGLPNAVGTGLGPLFASDTQDFGQPQVEQVSAVALNFSTGTAAFNFIETGPNSRRTWATAAPISAVPLPAGGLLLLSGLGGVAALKRRKKRAA